VKRVRQLAESVDKKEKAIEGDEGNRKQLTLPQTNYLPNAGADL
jgi:hypothetical protein